LARLVSITRSRTEPASRVERLHRIPQAPRRRLPEPYDDQADPRQYSAHISKETKAWLAKQPTGRFEFTFTPKHGSWRNLVEGFFSKLARSVLRHIRTASKQELKDRITAAMDEFNRYPVVHTWSHKLDQAA
jgi:DDE superfamily endonuclease